MANTATVAIGQSVTVTAIPVDKNGNPVVGAVINGLFVGVSDQTLATTTANPDGSFTITPLKTGSANVSGAATVTDPDGTVVQNVDGTGVLTITAGPNDTRTVSLQLNFVVNS